MTPSPLAQIASDGQSLWLDDLSRDRITTGELAAMIDTHFLRGVTTNPTIFATALTNGGAYQSQLAALARAQVAAQEAATVIPADDVSAACDVFAAIFTQTRGRDGWVSIEVDPRLAHDTAETIAQARALHQRVDRPNVMIKIPATLAGLPAITATIAAGISVNATLIFSPGRYVQVADAYLEGLKQAQDAGQDLSQIHSVASVFVSRFDGIVDTQLAQLNTSAAAALMGKIAIANAQVIYGEFLDFIQTPVWRQVAAAGANVQRPLWASTGVKNPNYADTYYVDQLVAPQTVNTVPAATLSAVADHGKPRTTALADEVAMARMQLATARELGIDLDGIATNLEDDGVAKFITSWEQLLETLAAGLRQAH